MLPAGSTLRPGGAGSRLGTALVLIGLALSACSGERPTLVEAAPVTEAGTDATGSIPMPTTTIALPERSDCESVTGPGPAQARIGGEEPVSCLAVASYHQIELANQGMVPLDVTVGSATVTVQPSAVHLTEAVDTLMPPGPSRVLVDGATVAVVWLVDPAEDRLAGAEIGLRSIGAVELGQEPAGVTAAMGGIPVSAAGTACHLTTLESDPYSPVFTFRDGQLTVVQIFNPSVATLSGIRVGSTTADVTAAYGDRIEALAVPADDPTRQLFAFIPSDEEDLIYRLIFDLTDGLVTTMRFGATEIVVDQPGCAP